MHTSQPAGQIRDADLTRPLSDRDLKVVRARLEGSGNILSPTKCPVVRSVLRKAQESLPQRFSPKDLFDRLGEAVHDIYIKNGLDQPDREARRESLQAIEAKVGEYPPKEAYAQHFPKHADEVEVFHQNVISSREYASLRISSDLTNALIYVLPPGMGEALLRNQEPLNKDRLAEDLREAHALSVEIHRFLTSTCQLPSSGGKEGHAFELAAPIKDYGLRVAIGSPPLLRFRAGPEVSLVTALGEMPCFRGADGITREKAEEVLAALFRRFDLNLFAQTPATRLSTSSLVRHERVVLLSLPGKVASLPDYPWTHLPKQSELIRELSPTSRSAASGIVFAFTGKIGGENERAFVKQVSEALSAVRTPATRAAFQGELPQEIFVRASALFDRHRSAPAELIPLLFEGPKDERKAALVALAALGPSAVHALLEHDKREYLPEALADLFDLWGVAHPKNAVFGPELSPLIYDQAVKMCIAAMDRDGATELVRISETLCRDLPEAKQTLARRATELLDAENPHFQSILRERIEASGGVMEAAFLLGRLGNFTSRIKGDNTWLARELRRITEWAPADDFALHLQADAIHAIFHLLSEAEQQPRGITPTLVSSAFSIAISGKLPSNFEYAFVDFLKRFSHNGLEVFAEVEEQFRAAGSPSGWSDAFYKLARHFRSAPQGWARDSEVVG